MKSPCTGKEMSNNIMKRLIIISFILLLPFFNVCAQSDTTRWGGYLSISTRITQENYVKFMDEYQDTLGNILIPKGKYAQLGLPDDFGFINAWKESAIDDIENNVGFIDIHQNVLIPFKYSRVFSFEQNLACATRNHKTGYINRKGEVVIPFIYTSRKDFNRLGVVVIEKGNKEVLIDTLGNEIINTDHPYSEIKENFPHDDLLWIRKGDKWAFFDLKGKQLTPFIFDELYPANLHSNPFEWGGQDLRWFYKGLTVVQKDNQYLILNKQMDEVVAPGTYQRISPMSYGGMMIVKQNSKFGLVDHNLSLIQPVEFDTISNSPADGHEPNFPTFWAKKNDNFYLFDTLGRWTDSIEYDKIEVLDNNYYLVTRGGKQWRLNKFGNSLKEEFEFVREDENGFIAKKDSLCGLVDSDGAVILPFEYEDIISEHLGNIFVKRNGKWGVVDEDNKQLLPFKYDYIAYAWDHSDERNYIVVRNDKFGKVTETDQEIFPCMYDGITTWVEYGPGGHYVMIGDKMGLISYLGKVWIPAQYDKVNCIEGTGLTAIYNDGKIGLYSIKNKSFLLPLEYDFIFVDADFFGFNEKPTRIITYKDGIVNILDHTGKIIRSKVSKQEIMKEFEVNIDDYRYEQCSYPLLLMTHNKTYQLPDCVIRTLRDLNVSPESMFYHMEE